MGRSRLELSDIIRKYGNEFRETHSLTKKQKSVLSAIEKCRTEALGYHVEQCSHCKHIEVSYNSCRDRHCPKCQGHAQRQWVKQRINQLLPVPYYHLVFTLPSSLFPFSLYNKRLIYTLLFDAAASTLKQFGADPKWLGGQIGFFGILHTWGQTLWHHPHIHFIVAGGAIGPDERWIPVKHKGKFLFPVRAISKVFRGKFMKQLEDAIRRNDYTPIPLEDSATWSPESFLKNLVKKSWVVYCKSPFENAEHVIRYIGRYTHRVAISNSRLCSIADGRVEFRYKDRRSSNNQVKRMKLSADDFLQRFLWHVLPEKFHRIRHYGFLCNGKAKTNCSRILKMLGAKVLNNVKQKKNRAKCRVCNTGYLFMICLVTARCFVIQINSPGNMIAAQNG